VLYSFVIQDASDAVALIRDGDTLCVSGFVTQCSPEAILKALGDHFEENDGPSNLTLLFGGGPGDFGERGLSHLAKKKLIVSPSNSKSAASDEIDVSTDESEKAPSRSTVSMLRRTIGSHYGQIPKVAEMALRNEVEAWTLPLGSISRMIRAQAEHSPCHITNTGLGTFVDPDHGGGAANQAAQESSLKLVSKLSIDGEVRLCYKAIPVDVAIIRGTTADGLGNITVEHESLLCDQRNIATAAKNSGGVVIAQVKRVAANGSLSSRQVAIPGALVDCVVVVDEPDHDDLHPMSYEERYNPNLTGELISPAGEEVVKMAMDVRKIIARRACFALKPNLIVNLGIGLPEGVASVAGEEGLLQYITLSTEPGVFGGLPASGRSFGPAYNASALIEMNQMFDFYNGSGLDLSFLGAAQISRSGDVNVSRLSRDKIIGPGGFVDISQSTRNICFMSTLTTKGLEVKVEDGGLLSISNEGRIKKFVNEVYEKTFCGDEAVRRGQQVFYVTERAVFRRSNRNETLELIEIAPGVDLQRDVLDQMEFTPIVSSDLKQMDSRIFRAEKMNVAADFFGSLEERFIYHEAGHTMYVDLFGVTLDTTDDVDGLLMGLRSRLSPLVKSKGPIDMVVNYDGFDVRKGLEHYYGEKVREIEVAFYRSVRRYTGSAFRRAKLKKELSIGEWDTDELYDEFDKNSDGLVSIEELRDGMQKMFQIQLTPNLLRRFQRMAGDTSVDREMFVRGIKDVLAIAA